MAQKRRQCPACGITRGIYYYYERNKGLCYECYQDYTKQTKTIMVFIRDKQVRIKELVREFYKKT